MTDPSALLSCAVSYVIDPEEYVASCAELQGCVHRREDVEMTELNRQRSTQHQQTHKRAKTYLYMPLLSCVVSYVCEPDE